MPDKYVFKIQLLCNIYPLKIPTQYRHYIHKYSQSHLKRSSQSLYIILLNEQLNNQQQYSFIQFPTKQG